MSSDTVCSFLCSLFPYAYPGLIFFRHPSLPSIFGFSFHYLAVSQPPRPACMRLDWDQLTFFVFFRSLRPLAPLVAVFCGAGLTAPLLDSHTQPRRPSPSRSSQAIYPASTAWSPPERVARILTLFPFPRLAPRNPRNPSALFLK